MFGRFRNRGVFRRAFGRLSQPLQLQDLSQANRFMAAGHYRQAVPVFARLAQAAQQAGRTRQAANLYAQAASAAAASGDEPLALLHARQALLALQQMGMLARASGLMAMLLLELKNHGLANAAAQLEQEFTGQFDQAAFTPALKTQAPQQSLHLPSICPQCGAPVRRDEVEWIDAASAECAYCGGVIQGQ